MSAVSSVGVIPSGYLTADDYSSLTTTQQTVANAVQGQLNSAASLVASLNGGLSTPTNLLSAQTTYTSTAQVAAAAGRQVQQNSQLLLLSSLGGGGASSGLIGQWAALQSLTQGGVSNLFSSTSASDAVAAGHAAQAASQQALLQSIYDNANANDGDGFGAGSLLELYA